MDLRTPQISNYFSAHAYLNAFYLMNKSEVPNFSYRVFANAIDWPSSYMSDIIKGRKKLTIIRAVQFAHFVKLSSIETERLIYIAMTTESDSAVQEFSKKRLLGTHKDEARTTEIDYDAFKHVDIGAVFATLVWAKKRLPDTKIKSLLYTFPKLDTQRIASIVDWLEQNKIVVFDETGSLISFAQDFHHDEHTPNPADSGVQIHEQYAESFIEFIHNAQTPCMYNSGFVEIPRKDFLQIAQKILEVRNWLMDYSKETCNRPKNQIQDTFVFQFDINLYTILDKSSAKALSES